MSSVHCKCGRPYNSIVKVAHKASHGHVKWKQNHTLQRICQENYIAMNLNTVALERQHVITNQLISRLHEAMIQHKLSTQRQLDLLRVQHDVASSSKEVLQEVLDSIRGVEVATATSAQFKTHRVLSSLRVPEGSLASISPLPETDRYSFRSGCSSDSPPPLGYED